MVRRTIKTAVKVLGYSVVIVVLGCVLYFDEERVQTLKLKHRLRWGTPIQKEAVLDLFMYEHPRSLVPAVINAIMDDTVLPKHGDTGWGTVYHQAATAMCNFAQLVDGKTCGQRGLQRYSFHDDVGRASLERRREVHRNWLRWHAENKNVRMAYCHKPHVSGWRSRYENHLRLAQIYVRIGDHKAAENEYEQVVENTSPVSQIGDGLVRVHIGALICLNRDEEAKAILSQAKERFGDSDTIRQLVSDYDAFVQSCDEHRIRK